MRRAMAAFALMVSPAWADGERAGDFDYYVLSLSWSSAWCALTGDRREDPQCDAGRGLSWTLHGLWPQYEEGWPQYCRTVERDPSRGETAAMADIMGGAGLAFHQWKKHGRCTGMSPRDYFAASRRAFGRVTLPEVFSRVNRDMTLPARVVEEAFVEANPGLSGDAITVRCDEGLITEVRICLDKSLEPRRCGEDVIRDCRMKDARLEALR